MGQFRGVDALGLTGGVRHMAPEQVQGDEAQHEVDMEVHAPAVGPDEPGKEGHGDGRRNGLPHDPGCIGPSPFLFGEPVFDKDTLQGIVKALTDAQYDSTDDDQHEGCGDTTNEEGYRPQYDAEHHAFTRSKIVPDRRKDDIGYPVCRKEDGHHHAYAHGRILDAHFKEERIVSRKYRYVNSIEIGYKNTYKKAYNDYKTLLCWILLYRICIFHMHLQLL